MKKMVTRRTVDAPSVLVHNAITMPTSRKANGQFKRSKTVATRRRNPDDDRSGWTLQRVPRSRGGGWALQPPPKPMSDKDLFKKIDEVTGPRPGDFDEESGSYYAKEWESDEFEDLVNYARSFSKGRSWVTKNGWKHDSTVVPMILIYGAYGREDRPHSYELTSIERYTPERLRKANASASSLSKRHPPGVGGVYHAHVVDGDDSDDELRRKLGVFREWMQERRASRR